MAVKFILLLLFSFTIFFTQALALLCSPANCNKAGLNIHSPFFIKNLQPQSCGLPGFQLSCKENNTIIRFPSHGNLIVKSLAYQSRDLYLLDPNSCVHEVFLNLNLSSTSFQYFYKVRNYTYLNCSSQLPLPFVPISCLSGSGHFVYTIKGFPEAVVLPPASCRVLKTVAIPFEYSPYLAENSFGLRLTWNLSEFQDSGMDGGRNGLQSKAEQHGGVTASYWSSAKVMYFGGISIVVAAAFVISVLLRRSTNDNQLQNSNANGKLLAREPDTVGKTGICWKTGSDDSDYEPNAHRNYKLGHASTTSSDEDL